MAKRIAVSELMLQLNSDPDFRIRRAEKNAQIAARATRLRVEQAQLRADLKKVGWPVESVWDLVNCKESYIDAIPVLFDHLHREYSDVIREGIARSLAVPEAGYGLPALVAEYRAARIGSQFKDGLAVAISGAASSAMIEDIVSLVRDQSLGGSRVFLLPNLKRSKAAAAKQALEDLASDPDLAIEIAAWRRAHERRQMPN